MFLRMNWIHFPKQDCGEVLTHSAPPYENSMIAIWFTRNQIYPAACASVNYFPVNYVIIISNKYLLDKLVSYS